MSFPSKEEERIMLKFYHSLDEASRRRYAALEARKLGYGGKKYIKELFNTSYDSISKGLSELSKEEEIESGRIRKQGGGRKQKKRCSDK